MTLSKTSDTSILALAMIPANLLAIAFVIGGTTLGDMIIQKPLLFSFLAMVAVAIVPDIIFSKKTFKLSQMRLASKSALHIIHLIVQSGTPSNIAFSPHVTRACQGVIFSSLELVKELMEKTSTKTGLKTFVHVIDKVYKTGRKYAADFKENMRIVFDDFLPKWNYRAVPVQLRFDRHFNNRIVRI